MSGVTYRLRIARRGANAAQAYRHAKDWCRVVGLRDADRPALDDLDGVVLCMELAAPRAVDMPAADRQPPQALLTQQLLGAAKDGSRQGC